MDKGPFDAGGKLMTLWGHLDELRERLVKSCITLLVMFIISLAFCTKILNFLKHPLEEALPSGTAALHFTGPNLETDFSLVRFKDDAERAKNIYKGVTPLSARDIAECVWFAASNLFLQIGVECLTIISLLTAPKSRKF